MSRSTEILRECYEAFNHGDVDAILRFVHPQFEVAVPPELSAEPDTYRGHDGIRRYFESFTDAMDEICFEPQRFWETPRCVVADVRMSARGRLTSIRVEQRFAQVWELREDKAFRATTYVSLPEALRAAGLPADAGSRADPPAAS
jgi:ketosteroid isomerase-like protein